MNYLTQLITPLTMILSIATACGVVLHDTSLDKAFVSAVDGIHGMLDASDGKVKLGSTPHTHSEGASLAKVMKEGRTHPRTTPRNSDRKHLHQKRTSHSDSDIDGHRLVLGPRIS